MDRAIYTGHFGVMRKLRNKETGEEMSLQEAKPLLDALHKALFQTNTFTGRQAT